MDIFISSAIKRYRGPIGYRLKTVPLKQALLKSSAPVRLGCKTLLTEGTNGAAWRATSERNGTNRGYPESSEPDVKSRDYRGRAGAVFEGVYVVRRRMCGTEDDCREERRRRWNGTGQEGP